MLHILVKGGAKHFLDKFVEIHPVVEPLGHSGVFFLSRN